MIEQKLHQNTVYANTDYRREVNFKTMPVIKKSFTSEGVKMYRGENGRTFIASVFDKIWKK